MFYLLSLITGVLECGWIAFGAVHSLPLWQILCYPLAYHIGNLFPKPFSLNRKCLAVMGALAFISTCLTFIGRLSGSVIFVLTCISLFLLSTIIQSVRSGLKSEGNRLTKRVFRVGGFVLAPLAAAIPSIILLASTLVALYSLKNYIGKFKVTRLKGQSGYSAVMVFHQLHYFFYAHITLTAMSLIFVRRTSACGVIFATLLFCCTWVTYMSVEPLASRLTGSILPVFYTGHIGVSLLLLSMSLVTRLPLFITLWVMTGFGGGTVYTISARAKSAMCYDKSSMTISENIGHTLGLLSAVGISAGFGAQSPQIMLVLGFASALLAVIFMSATSRKEKKYENIKNYG